MESRAGFRRAMAAAAAAAVALAAVTPATAAAPPTPGTRRADHVILVSIDGLVPDAYLRPQEYAMPNLQALRASGSWAEGVIGQYPSLTYPSHTSIATGVRPARHGITQNTAFDAKNGSRQWLMDARLVKAPALWNVARAAGLTTAALSWPVTAGAPFVTASTGKGQHGFLPTEPRMHTGLVAAGAGIRRAVVVPLARQVDVAPTVAALLGMTMDGVDGVPMVGILTEGDGGRR